MDLDNLTNRIVYGDLIKQSPYNLYFTPPTKSSPSIFKCAENEANAEWAGFAVSLSALNKSNSNINELKALLSSLSTITSEEHSIMNYNKKFKETMNSVYSNTEIIEKFIHKITLTDFGELPNTPCVPVLENIELYMRKDYYLLWN